MAHQDEEITNAYMRGQDERTRMRFEGKCKEKDELQEMELKRTGYEKVWYVASKRRDVACGKVR